MKGKVFLAIAMAIGLTVLLQTTLAEPPARAQGGCDRWVLGQGGSDSGDCSDETAPCATIQYAIDQAADGETICVAKESVIGPLTYEETLVITKSVTLDGAWEATCCGTCAFTAIPCDPANVTIDALGTGRVISITGNVAPTIRCFTITGGDAAGLGGDPGTTVENDAGGGIYSRHAAPIIVHNVITGNYGCISCPVSYGRGGGIYLLNAPSTAVISNNLIVYNVADEGTWGQGGGIMLRDSDAQILSNTIEYNRAGHSAGYGGGIAVRDGAPTLADNVLAFNTAGQGVQGLGGGIYVWSAMPVHIERNVLRLNRALQGTASPGLYSRGGGIYFDGPFATIRDNALYGNVATLLDAQGLGGGMYLHDLSDAAVVQGNVIANDNRASYASDGSGGAIYLDTCYATIAENRMFNNIAASGTPGSGGGIYVNGGGGLIERNVITNNRAVLGAVTGTGWGGGMAIYDSEVLVRENQIVDNVADSAPSATGFGGGIYVHLGAPQIVRNDILSNTTSGGGGGSGGGLHLEDTRAWVDGNVVLYNESVGTLVNRGGGIGVDSCAAFTLTNNIFAQNSASIEGSGIAIVGSSAGDLVHNTIAENQGGIGVGVHVVSDSHVALTNNIVISHWQGIANGDPGTSTIIATHTLFEDNGADYAPGTVNSTNEIAGPASLLPNYHLANDSNAIANALPLAWITHDVDGDVRPYRGTPDVGADEVSCLAHIASGGGVYFSIQEAVRLASSGQTVRVAEGTCYENVVITESLTLEGGWDQAFATRSLDPATATTIDGLGRGRAISITEMSGAIAPIIDGFTLTGGDATDLGGSVFGYDVGGGLYSWYADTTVSNCIVRDNVASTKNIGWGGGLGFQSGNPTVRDCLIEDNVASTASNGYGGGLYFRYGTATVTTNTIRNNVATAASGGLGYGGGIQFHFNSATLQDNVIQGNTASLGATGYGGGISLYGTNLVSLDSDLIAGNAANVPNSAGYGGGISVRHNSEIEMDDVTVQENVAYSDPPSSYGQGGGVFIEESTLTMQDGEVTDNAADNGGGAYILFSNGPALSRNSVRSNADAGVILYGCEEGQLDNNIIADNQTRGVMIVGHTTRMRHNTIARNGDIGILVDAYYAAFGNVALTNTILVRHTTGISVSAGSTATLEATLWGAGTWANGSDTDGGGLIDTGAPAHNVWSPPHFVDPGDGDYHLRPGSAAVDAAIPVGMLDDVDGDARPIGPAPDLGADEAWLPSFLPLILRNG